MAETWGSAVVAVREARLERERRQAAELADYMASDEFAAVVTYLAGRALVWMGETYMADHLIPSCTIPPAAPRIDATAPHSLSEPR